VIRAQVCCADGAASLVARARHWRWPWRDGRLSRHDGDEAILDQGGAVDDGRSAVIVCGGSSVLEGDGS